jgi:hypothetical protein
MDDVARAGRLAFSINLGIKAPRQNVDESFMR